MKLSEYFDLVRACIKDGWRVTRIAGGQWHFKKPRHDDGFDYEGIQCVADQKARQLGMGSLYTCPNEALMNDISRGSRCVVSDLSNKRARLVSRVYRKLIQTQYRKVPC